MAGLLTATLARWASEPFAYGDDDGKAGSGADCATSVLRYVEQATGRRIRVRPRHRSKFTATLLLKLNGGFERYAAAVMAELGCAPTDDPVRGDVALVDFPAIGPTAAICLGTKFAAKGHREIVVAEGPVIRAWKISR